MYITPDIFKYDKYKFNGNKIYYCPPPGKYDIYLNYIKNLPVNSESVIFGLNDNVEIIFAQNEGTSLLETVLRIQSKKSYSYGKSKENVILDLLKNIKNKIPEPFDKQKISKKFHFDYYESINNILLQKNTRYNALLNLIKKSIIILDKGLTGEIIMDEETEKISNSLFINLVPKLWSKIFLSLKPLSSWIIDLNSRISFFQNWIKEGKTPNVFWFSGFSFPQAFLTAVLKIMQEVRKLLLIYYYLISKLKKV